MTEDAWLWLYVACMAAGALLFTAWSRNPKGVPQYEYAVAIFIPVWSGLAYTAMALGQGIVLVDGKEVYVARYLDWIVTTPLLLFALASSGMFFRPLDKSTIATLIGLDVIMILSGLFADLSVREGVQWFWYVVGCVCLALILSIIWGRVRREAYAHDDEIGRSYTRIAGYFTALWFGYPLIWALSPSGLGLFGDTTTVALFVLLPIFSKVGFSIYDLHELRKLAPRYPQFDEPAEGARLRGAPA
jgi:bacteriorhodopsin